MAPPAPGCVYGFMLFQIVRAEVCVPVTGKPCLLTEDLEPAAGLGAVLWDTQKGTSEF